MPEASSVPETANIMKSVTCSITLLRCTLKCKKIRQSRAETERKREHGTLELRAFYAGEPSFPSNTAT
jgi:hypothetical protein